VSRSAALMMASWFSTLLTALSMDDVTVVEILLNSRMTAPVGLSANQESSN
jgi:hypothetical protein